MKCREDSSPLDCEKGFAFGAADTAAAVAAAAAAVVAAVASVVAAAPAAPATDPTAAAAAVQFRLGPRADGRRRGARSGCTRRPRGGRPDHWREHSDGGVLRSQEEKEARARQELGTAAKKKNAYTSMAEEEAAFEAAFADDEEVGGAPAEAPPAATPVEIARATAAQIEV